MRHEFPSGDEGLAQNRPESGPHTGLPAATHRTQFPILNPPAPPNSVPRGRGGADAYTLLPASGCGVSGLLLDSLSLTPPILSPVTSFLSSWRAGHLPCLRLWELQWGTAFTIG